VTDVNQGSRHDQDLSGIDLCQEFPKTNEISHMIMRIDENE